MAKAVKKTTKKAATKKAVTKKPAKKVAAKKVVAKKAVAKKIAAKKPPAKTPAFHHEIVIVGGGAAGIATAASLLRRKGDLDIAIIDGADTQYYQPGWTLVGAGVFEDIQTKRSMSSVIPAGVKWVKDFVASMDPNNNQITLDDGRVVSYTRLIVTPGLKLDWDAIEGLSETLGKNGVTSNYRYDLAPYTWKLVQELQNGRALFTQPAMPIKCAGAPQKALYLSADHWFQNGVLKNIDVQFYNAGGVIFGVKEYVEPLMNYIKKYDATLQFMHNLTKIDGKAKKAWFTKTDADGKKTTVETTFDMIHVCPPQVAPDFVRSSPLANDAGWVDVDQHTLKSTKFANVWSLGDVMSAPNAKTAAAARMQAPIVAHNLLADMGLLKGTAQYNGYGSCPLTVEKGKIILAEFGYGGKLLPSFPAWANNSFKPTRRAWFLKERLLPPVYWAFMLKGREWLAKPNIKN
ncbi:MAG: FAD/NAD(P)-binding oxidoreductase [Rhizobiaceae bacterium]